ncbi:hypothetical protein [Pseudomonas rubra]|uniref:Uncharacterized protein n=1 Tax=Pseudomonas rubra TaxID=2942627 RepID=A0ABT5P9P3_9PSED|nr:hypothetical protein [Pseudomonas rubra]MDD1015016.1 hypothetical protein [Pseudomonas rubra]MDD1038649.1 hypothetical protein [Pseudomonas rubra]MDD1154659.1 hypothetical protein [Pseudomonas rubra]
MPTDRQLSFVANVRLTTENKALCAAETYFGRPFMSKITRSSGVVSKVKNLSNLVSIWDNSSKFLSLYLRHTNGGYHLYVRSADQRGHGLYLNSEGMLFLREVDRSPDVFQLSDGKTHNLLIDPDATGGTSQLYLYHRTLKQLIGSKTYRQSASTFTAVQAGGTPLPLDIEVIEVNSPYLGNPNEV